MFDNTFAGFVGAVLAAITGAQLAIQKKHEAAPPEVDLSREAAMLDGPMQALAAVQSQLNADQDTASLPAPTVPNTDPQRPDPATPTPSMRTSSPARPPGSELKQRSPERAAGRGPFRLPSPCSPRRSTAIASAREQEALLSGANSLPMSRVTRVTVSLLVLVLLLAAVGAFCATNLVPPRLGAVVVVGPAFVGTVKTSRGTPVSFGRRPGCRAITCWTTYLGKLVPAEVIILPDSAIYWPQPFSRRLSPGVSLHAFCGATIVQD